MDKLQGRTDQKDRTGPTDQQGEYKAICLFESQKIEKKAEICNSSVPLDLFLNEKDELSAVKAVELSLFNNYDLLSFRCG